MFRQNWKKSRALFSGTALAALAITGATTASAQPAGTVLGELVVTARKKEEGLQSVPVAITAQTGQQLEQQGIRTTTDLTKIVPSLTVTTSSAQNSAAVFSLRGQAAGDILLTNSQPVGVYEDSANVPHPGGLQGSFFDIQRIEVLKGPQGTLYGRNTTGGAVNIITRGGDYNGVHGFVSGEVGNYDDWKIGGAVNVPIIADVLAVRLAYQHWNREGYGKSSKTGQDFGNDHDDDVARLSIRFDPTANLSSITKVEYVHLDQNGLFAKPVFILNGTAGQKEILTEGQTVASALGDSDLFHNNSEQVQFDRTRVWHAVEDLTWAINDDLKLRSITGYHSLTESYIYDLDATSAQVLELNAPLVGGLAQNPIRSSGPDPEYHGYTQEFDLSGSSFGHLDWLIGLFASTEKGSGIHGTEQNPLAAPPPTNASRFTDTVSTISNGAKTKTWAIYTQNDIHLSDRVTVTLGARYTEEREKNKSQPYVWHADTQLFTCTGGPTGSFASIAGCNFINGAAKSNGISYLASYNFQITPQMLVYLKTARGFRGGALQYRAPNFPPVSPEFATDYEIGFKSDFFDHRLRTNLAAYHTNYENKQETVIVPTTVGITTVLQNAASAKIDGFEAEVNGTPVTGWTIYGTLTYLNGKYQNYPCTLQTTNPAVPDNTAVCGLPPFPLSVIDRFYDASGERFAEPQWRYSIGSRYQHEVGPGTLGGQLDWTWRDKSFIAARVVGNGFGPTSPVAAIQADLNKPIGLLNGRIDYTMPDYQVTVALFATNLLDKKYSSLGLGVSSTGFQTIYPQEPRTFGVTVTKAFGQE